MVPTFLPAEASQLTEATSIALVETIQKAAIATPLSPDPIETTFVRHGSGGTPIVLIHGFDSSVLEFRRLLPRLAEKNEVWAIDLLGFGFTDRPADIAISPQTINTHLYYTWKTLINQSVILVGASMGGAAAIALALNHPEVVKKLVLIDSAGMTQGPALGKYLVPPLGYLAAEFLRRPAVRKQVSLQAYVDPTFVSTDALRCAALHLQQPGWNRAMVSFTRSGGYTSVAEQVKNLEPPTLILWGDRDRILGTADAERFQQAIPSRQLVWIESCGHVPHLEKPQTTADHILEFALR